MSVASFVAPIREAFYELPWDEYLVRQKKIEFLKKHLSGNQRNALSDDFWTRFYQGDINDMEEALLMTSLQMRYPAFQPSRRRAISRFELEHASRRWRIERRPCESFHQATGRVAAAWRQDYRLGMRRFAELDDALVNDDLIRLLRKMAERVNAIHPDARRLEIDVHHTQLVVRPGESATNSPEGIHQDGMDYIVSALVVERRNIEGGVSVIYAADKRTRLFEATLHEGQGLFQPDRGSDLWHRVSDIRAVGSEPGYRSSIGFDITVKR